MSKKYLIYLDILGFKAIPEILAKITGFDEDEIREKFLSYPLKREIDKVMTDGIQISKGISEIEGSDNYILMADSIQKSIELVGEVTRIKIPHKKCRFLPLEVVIGVKEIDVDANIEEPINRRGIIDFLNDKILNPYRQYYKKGTGRELSDTFLLFTELFFHELKPLDKKYCKKIKYKNKKFIIANLRKFQQRAKVCEFLKKIGYINSDWYQRIEEIYVPPLEYKDIKRSLRNRRFIFITGTQEYGKTYTTVRLMWEYYNKGYEPRWIKGAEPTERIEVRRRLEDIRTELEPKHIIYFEDPFGKTEYEKREGLEREIRHIIDSVKRVNDVYIIITSREEVFKEFEKEKISADTLDDFNNKLNIKNVSYNYEKRKEILLKWAEEEDCKWLRDIKLKKFVSDSIREYRSLPSPLSIKNFVMATKFIGKGDELEKKIIAMSKDTANVFSKEIKTMTDDKLLFLSFLLISGWKINFIKQIYRELVIKLNITDAWEFDRVLDWFRDDKVNIRTINDNLEFIEFSHSTYSETLEFLLVENGYITRINNDIISKLLISLSKHDEAVAAVTRVVTKYFDKFPEPVKNLLLGLSKNINAQEALVHGLSNITSTCYFEIIIKNLRNNIPLKHLQILRGYLDDVEGTFKGVFLDKDLKVVVEYTVRELGHLLETKDHSYFYETDDLNNLSIGMCLAPSTTISSFPPQQPSKIRLKPKDYYIMRAIPYIEEDGQRRDYQTTQT